MKIAVIGTQCIGKTTFINDFLKKWPMFKTPDKKYRDILKEKNLPHSENTNEETQKIIMDFLIDQVTACDKEDNVILDRSVLDCFAYTCWLNLKGKASDDFVDSQRILVREAIRLYSVLLYLPLTKFSPVNLEDDGFRSVNEVFREEVDNIFKVFEQAYYKGDTRMFPPGDSPAIIEIYGSPEERIKMTELYINEKGTFYGEEESLIKEIDAL